MFSGWNQSIGCAVAWVNIARASESEYPFHPVGQFYRLRAAQSWCQKCSGFTKLIIIVCSGSYCTSIIVGFRVYSNTLATLFTHFPTVWAVKCSLVGTRVLAVLLLLLFRHSAKS